MQFTNFLCIFLLWLTLLFVCKCKTAQLKNRICIELKHKPLWLWVLWKKQMLVSNLNEILFSVNCQIPTLWWRSIPACWGCFMFASAFSWFLEGLRFFISDNNSHQKYSWKKNKSNVSNKIKRWCHTPVFIGSHFPSKLPNYIFFYKKTSKVGCVMKIIFQYFVFFILDLIVFLLVKIVPTHQVFPETKITLVPWWTVFFCYWMGHCHQLWAL